MATVADDEFVVAWPTLGFLVADWVEHHCIIPDGFSKGEPFAMYDWQLWCTVNHYRIRPKARPAGTVARKAGRRTVLANSAAFHYRRSLIIAPQKAGKGPWSATIVCAEAVGPVVFAGFAGTGDLYRCRDHGCRCGWEYEYEPGEPMGKPWPTPLIQLVATAEKQVDNVYRPLQAMAKHPKLAPLMQVTEDFIRCPNAGQIDVVTSSAQSKLGAPIIFALQDESGLYTETNKMVAVADTMMRGAAGMGGRSMETSNAYNPVQNSTCQQTIAASQSVDDIFVFWRRPPDDLGLYKNKKDRRKIHRYAYAGCDHVDLDSIEGTATELILKDIAQAERFFGNRDVAGSSHWITAEEWAATADADKVVKRREAITLGFDGSDGTRNAKRVADSTVLRGCRISDGHRFTIASWEHPRDPDGNPIPEWYVPRLEVMEKIRWAFSYYDVILAGFDPPYWRSEIAELTEEFGDDRVVEFRTANDRLMSGALERLKTTTATHDVCAVVDQHAVNAVSIVKEYRDDNDERKRLVLVSKASKDSPDKIDGLISDAIAHDMRDRAIAAGARKKKSARLVTFR